MDICGYTLLHGGFSSPCLITGGSTWIKAERPKTSLTSHHMPQLVHWNAAATNLLACLGKNRWNIRWMEEILHQLIGGLSYYLKGFNHPRWCRIPSIHSSETDGSHFWHVKKNIAHQTLAHVCTHFVYHWGVFKTMPGKMGCYCIIVVTTLLFPQDCSIAHLPVTWTTEKWKSMFHPGRSSIG